MPARIFLFAYFQLLSGFVFAQSSPDTADELRFDRVLVYEQSDYNGSIVRYQVLMNSATGVFGFDKKLARLILPGQGDGFTFATGHPDGSYRIYIADYDGRRRLTYRTAARYASPAHALACRQYFAKRYQPTGRQDSRFGLAGTEYKASLGRRDTEYLLVGTAPFNTYPLYLFNELPLEAKLPDAHPLQFADRLTNRQLLLEARKVYYSETVNGKPAVSTLRLVYYGPIQYVFDASAYRPEKVF